MIAVFSASALAIGVIVTSLTTGNARGAGEGLVERDGEELVVEEDIEREHAQRERDAQKPVGATVVVCDLTAFLLCCLFGRGRG